MQKEKKVQAAAKVQGPKQVSFKLGDKVVYPGQGVGEVMGIEHKEVAGQRQSFYVLRILDNGMRILIPINKVNQIGRAHV